MTTPSITLQFDHTLVPLLRRQAAHLCLLTYPLTRRASIKDILEALGIPHTEVGRIMLDGRETGFGAIPQDGDGFVIFSLSPELPVTEPSYLRPDPLPGLKFMVDINVGKLARLLRMAGVDAETVPSAPLREIALAARRDNRILLTRNSDLLRMKEVVFGHLLRSQESEHQFREVAALYSLRPDVSEYFSRCLGCNFLLEEVRKQEIVDRLEPLTKQYYFEFSRCPECDQIYWRGSHHEHMVQRLRKLCDSSTD